MRKKAAIIGWIAFIFPLLTLVGGVYWATEIESFWIFLACALSAWLSYVFISSYSELLESSDETNTMVRILLEKQEELKKEFPDPTTSQAPKAPEKETKVPVSVPAPAQKVEATTVIPDPNNAEYVICSNCGTRQKANRILCFNCGATFNK